MFNSVYKNDALIHVFDLIWNLLFLRQLLMYMNT